MRIDVGVTERFDHVHPLGHLAEGGVLPVEVLTSLACVALFYPTLRLTVFRPQGGIGAEVSR